MNKLMLTPPKLDDETVVKINDFLYEVLDAFESHYCYQILRYRRTLRGCQVNKVTAKNLWEDGEEGELPF